MDMLGRSVTVAGVLAVVLSAAANAQDPVGPEFRVNSFTTLSQYRPAVGADADGNFVVVWRSSGQDGSESAVVGQRFDRLGTPRGAEFVVNTFTTGTQSYPAVAVDASGRFVITWRSNGQDGDNYGIFARRFDTAGTPLGVSEFRVNATTTGNQSGPAVAYGPNGDFVVVWESLGQDGSYWGLFGRRFDSSGGAVGTEFPVNTHTTSSQRRPVVAVAPDGTFVVVWQSFGQDGSSYGVFARRFDTAGSPTGPEFRVNAVTTGYQEDPDVAMDGQGNFVVVWQDWPRDDGSFSVMGQRFDAAANPLGGEFLANTFTTGHQLRPTVAREPSGDFVVAWASAPSQDGSSYGVFAQRFDASGVRVGNEFQVNTHTPSRQSMPDVASLGEGRFVVAWESYYQDGSGAGVFAQRYGDLVFRDDFETGDTSRWSAEATDAGDLAVTVAAAMKFTTFGLQAFVDDTTGLFVQDDTPKDETTYRARFYFHPGDFDPGQAQGHFRTRIFIGFEEAPTRRLFALVLRRQGSQYSLMGRTRRDDNTQADTGFFPIATAQHFIELRWKRAGAAGANDGIFELWIDGIAQASMTTLDNDVSAVDFVRMGALSVKSGASGTLFFDEFESRRETMVGP